MNKPLRKPNNSCFSSGPCAKRPGWTIEDALKGALIGRSHRSSAGKKELEEVIKRSSEMLKLPDDYRLGIVPASDTGAFEMAMWSLLGERGVDVLAWESFGSGWVSDICNQLKIKDVRRFEAPYGELPQLTQVDCNRDIVFTWNGTTSGVMVPNGDWIADDRQGLTLCDATSAVFAMDLPWHKLDVTTYSWQKAMGGEAAHGIIILSPRAVARLTTYKPEWPIPKIFQLTQSGKLIEGIFKGETINTPSMLCVADALDALRWMHSLGGVSAMQARAKANLDVLTKWVDQSVWADFLAKDQQYRSCTSICLIIKDEWFLAQSTDFKQSFIKKMVGLLEKEHVAYDIGAYRDAPVGLRIWGGSTVEASDISDLLPWLDWAYEACRSSE
jgi:phosphoserine aminotransferase